MIQEIRRYSIRNTNSIYYVNLQTSSFNRIFSSRVQQGRDQSLDSIKEHTTVEISEASEELTEMKFLSPSPEVPSRSPRQGRSPRQLRSPRGRRKRCSLAGLNVRRFSTDSVLGSDSGSIYERTSLNIGRRLSRDVSCLTNSPPDINTRLRTPSPMVRRAEGSSTRSYQDVSDRTESRNAINGGTSHASVEILVSHEDDMPPVPPYPRMVPTGATHDGGRESEVELIRLWRGSEREVREALLATLTERQDSLDPDQDPGWKGNPAVVLEKNCSLENHLVSLVCSGALRVRARLQRLIKCLFYVVWRKIPTG